MLQGGGRDEDGSGWPRTVYVPRSDNGFGFTLRHFIVYPPESALDEVYCVDIAEIVFFFFLCNHCICKYYAHVYTVYFIYNN